MSNGSQNTDSSPDPLQWETDYGDAGQYELTVSTLGDTATREITVFEPPAFDLEIVSVTSPPIAGEDIDVEVEITNPGGIEGETQLELLVDGVSKDTIETVSVNPTNPKRKTLTWHSSAQDRNTNHTLRVKSKTDSVDRQIEPKKAPFFDITIETYTDHIEAGDDVRARVTVENTGDLPDTQTVSLWTYSHDNYMSTMATQGSVDGSLTDSTISNSSGISTNTRPTNGSHELIIELDGNSTTTHQLLTRSTEKNQDWGTYDLDVTPSGDGSGDRREIEIDVPVDPQTFRTNLIRYDGQGSGGNGYEWNDLVINASANTVPDNGNWPRTVGSKTDRVSIGRTARVGWSVIHGDVGYPSANLLEWTEPAIRDKGVPYLTKVTNPEYVGKSYDEYMEQAINQETIDLGWYDSPGRVGEHSVTVDLEEELGMQFGLGANNLLSVRLDVDVADRHVPDTGGGYIRSVDGSTVEIRLNYAKIAVNPVLNVTWIRSDHAASNRRIYFETKEIHEFYTGGRVTYDENYTHPRIRHISRHLPDEIVDELEERYGGIGVVDLESEFDRYNSSIYSLIDCSIDVTPDSGNWPDLTGGRLTSVTNDEATYKLNLAKGGARIYMTISYAWQ